MRTGAQFVHVPYKGGGQSLTDVVGGTLPMLYTAVAESGVPGFESSSWIGILAPAQTPRTIVERLQRALHAVLSAPDVRERLASLGISASGNTPAEFTAQIQSDLKKYAEIVKTANVKVD